MTAVNSFPAALSSKGLFTQMTLVGAAALAGAAANAQVTIVPVNETVGYGGSDVASFTSSLPGTSQFGIFRTITGGVFTVIAFANGGVDFKGGSHYLNSPAGKKFSTLAGVPEAAGRLVSSTHQYLQLTFPSYIAFQFTDTTNSNQLEYGWIELGGSTNAFLGQLTGSVTIDEYAYDVSGAQLPTAQTFSSAVPEPSAAVALAAFSALALGATGVRRLKAIRN